MPYPELVISLKAKFSRGILAFIDQGTTHMHFAFKEKQRYIKSLSYNKTVMNANEATNISSINKVVFFSQRRGAGYNARLMHICSTLNILHTTKLLLDVSIRVKLPLVHWSLNMLLMYLKSITHFILPTLAAQLNHFLLLVWFQAALCGLATATVVLQKRQSVSCKPLRLCLL